MALHSIKYIPLAAMLCCLASCSSMQTASTDTGKLPSAVTDHSLQAKRLAVVDAIKTGQFDQAKKLAEELVLVDPKSAISHLLLGLTYHSQGDAESLNLASSGYNASRQFAGQDMWPNYLAGVVAMQQQNAQQAMEFFSTAALADPDSAYAFEGLASAAYLSGRLTLAAHAAQRALHLEPDSTIAWRMLALTLAAQGNSQQLSVVLDQQPSQVSQEQQYWLKTRTQNLLRTKQVDEYTQVALNEDEDQEIRTIRKRVAPPKPLASQQLTVDVTLILSDKRNTSRTGVNLLDGLQAVFGYDRTLTSTKFRETGFPEVNTSNRTITRSISIPDVTYNLNIFNRGDRYYDAIARPSLTAFVGETSRFFIGDQLNVNVAGIQSAQIEKINVGVSMKIVPSQITEDGARFQLEVDRSFLSDTNAGTFTQAVGTFKQTVSATADIKFGETLILSGLSESVGDNTESRTPVVGDIPIIKTLFSNKTTLKRARSAIILVTPSLPNSFTRTVNYLPATTKLLELWDKVIEPSVGGEKLIQDITKHPQFSRFSHGDTQVRGLEDEMLKKILLQDIKNHASI